MDIPSAGLLDRMEGRFWAAKDQRFVIIVVVVIITID
jgi:hypothetical protein